MPLNRKPSSLPPTLRTDLTNLSSTSSLTRHPPSHHSMESTVDSGYASSSGGWLSPHPDYVLSRSYENWKIADAATQRHYAGLRVLEQWQEQLRAAKKKRNALTQRSATRCTTFFGN